jgi:dipeptidyl aminopeptidase/acylaminoacyl peptidase
MFFVHAADDRVSCNHSIVLFTALKQARVKSEMHIYETGGHGYGLRPTDDPVTRWPKRLEAWLKSRGIMK